TPVIMGTVDGARQTTTIGDLLPGRFDAGHMTRAG
ncbi:MAG TPA: cytidine deaminase, partial [Paracoccus sp.]|nr:cytidine deaminase [Paracoccus sp. (in: a-proteobacteria)]